MVWGIRETVRRLSSRKIPFRSQRAGACVPRKLDDLSVPVVERGKVPPGAAKHKLQACSIHFSSPCEGVMAQERAYVLREAQGLNT